MKARFVLSLLFLLLGLALVRPMTVAGKEDEPENIAVVTPTVAPTVTPTVTPTPSPTTELVAGVDYPINATGIRLMVAGTERLGRVVDGNGTEWTPEDRLSEFMVVYVVLGRETETEDVSAWFEGEARMPAVVDGRDQSRRWSFAALEIDVEADALVLRLIFLVKKGEHGYMLVLPGGGRVNLTQVPDFTEKPSRIGYLRAI